MTAVIEVKERPILFSGPMVRAILADTKTQTRPVITPQPELYDHDGTPCVRWRGRVDCVAQLMDDYTAPHCPYQGRLWVRETWAYHFGRLLYRADHEPESYYYDAKGWKPSIHMPRELSRIFLDVVNVRVERLWEISQGDAAAEGVDYIPQAPAALDHRSAFAGLWNRINANRGYSWESNPWVWAITFKRI